MTETVTPTQTRSQQLMTHYLTLKAAQEELDDQITAIKAELAQLNPTGGEILGKKILLSWPKRTNWKRLEADYPQTDYPQLYKIQLDQTAAKHEFSAAQLLAYQQTPDHPTVTIR